MASSAGRRTLLLATATRSDEQIGDHEHALYPRVDYIELQRVLGADVLDYGVYPGGLPGRLIRGVETTLRSDSLLAVLGAARQRRYDHIVCMSERVGLPLAVLRRARLLRARLSVFFHCLSARQVAVITRWRLFDAIDSICVLSHAVGDLVRGLDAPAERIHVLHFGVDHRYFVPRPDIARERFALSLGERRHRDYPALFAAAAGLDLELRVSAHGYSYAREKRPYRTDTAPPPNVTLLPFQSFTALRDLYARAAFVVLALRDVDYPAGSTTALEAMSMGCAVIAMPSRGLDEYVIHGETGIIVPLNDVGALRAAMQQLAADPALARRLGMAGRRRVETELNQERYVGQLAGLCGDNPRAEDAA